MRRIFVFGVAIALLFSLSTNASPAGQWLYRSKTGTMMECNSGSGRMMALPSAYRWFPEGKSAKSLTPEILVYADDVYHPAPNTYVDLALQQLGLAYEAYYDCDFSGFITALTSGTWRLVIFANDNFYPPGLVFEALNDYVIGGGQLILHGWTLHYNPAAETLLQTLGITLTSEDYNHPYPVYWWYPDHKIFTTPEDVPEFTELEDNRYGIYGYHVSPLPGFQALAGYSESIETDSSALVIGNDGRTCFRGFLDGQNDADLDSDGLPDGVELWINLISNIPYELEPIITKLSGGGGCFIATAAFGSYQEPHVWMLRQFRDKYLLTNRIGLAFTQFYYRHSPAIASFIAKRGWARFLTRTLLIPVYLVALMSLGKTLLPLTLFLMIILAVISSYRRRGVMTRKIWTVSAFLFFLLPSSPLFALDINLFIPATGESALTVLHTTKTLPDGGGSFGAFFTNAETPLKAEIGGKSVELSKHQALLILSGAYGVTDRFQIGGSIPYLVGQSSELSAQIENSAFGDLRIEGKYRFCGGKDRFGLALLPFITFPTGDEDAYLSADSLIGGLLLILDRNICDHTFFTFNLGVSTQEKEKLPTFEINNALHFGAGVTYKLANEVTNLSLEIKGRADGDSWFEKEEATPIEAIGSLTQKISEFVSFTLGIGAGLNDGYGTSDFRFLLGLRGNF